MATVEGGGHIVTDGLVLYVDAANPKSYISGSTSWNDLSRLSNNGLLDNGPTFNPDNNGSIVFDGIDDYIGFQSDPNLLFLGTAPYTLSAWINITSTTNLFHGIINRESGGVRNGYNMWFFQDPEVIAIASERWAGTGQKVAFVLLPTNQCIDTWNQFTVTFDGTNLKFYANGVFSNGMEATGNITNTSTTLEVGRRQSDYSNCKISNVKIYDKSLSSDEVLISYNALKGRFGL